MPKPVIREAKPEELEIINKHFAKEAVKKEDLYIMEADAANSGTMTVYFSYLGEDMIQGFHNDVIARQLSEDAEIVGFLFGHNKEVIPSGLLFQSEIVSRDLIGLDGTTAVAKHFMPSISMAKNLDVAGINTDDYVKAVNAGHTEAVSVGFQAGSFICSICGNDIRSFACPHMPGKYYNTAPDGETPVMKLCTYTVHQGSVKKRNILELSGVYAGAMPGARLIGAMVHGKDKDKQSSLQIKDGKVVDRGGNVVVSMNVKDFKENDVLRFNFQFDGSIEKVGETETDSEEMKIVSEQLRQADKERTALQTSVDAMKPLLDKTQADLDIARTDLDKEKTEHQKTLANLTLSETDKIELQNQIDALKTKIESLETELQAKTVMADTYMNDLKERCSKLSVRVNGMNHNPELFEKEIVNLSVADLKVKIEGLEKQLSQSIPVGKQTENVFGNVNLGRDAPNAVNKESEANKDPELFKTN